MKKAIVLLLILCMLFTAVAFTSCNKPDEPNKENENQNNGEYITYNGTLYQERATYEEMQELFNNIDMTDVNKVSVLSIDDSKDFDLKSYAVSAFAVTRFYKTENKHTYSIITPVLKTAATFSVKEYPTSFISVVLYTTKESSSLNFDDLNYESTVDDVDITFDYTNLPDEEGHIEKSYYLYIGETEVGAISVILPEEAISEAETIVGKTVAYLPENIKYLNLAADQDI